MRNAACECLVNLASCLKLDETSLVPHLKVISEELFSHLNISAMNFSFAGLADTLAKKAITLPIGLDHILCFLLGGIR